MTPMTTPNPAVAADATGTTSSSQPKNLTYPVARTVEQTDDYFGTTVSDPYRWMEDVDSAELKTWVDAENELTQSFLAKVPVRETMQKRLMELINFERYTAPTKRGSRYFYSHNSGAAESERDLLAGGSGGGAEGSVRSEYVLGGRDGGDQRVEHYG